MAAYIPEKQSGFLQSTYPVLFPTHTAFTLDEEQFRDFLKDELAKIQSTANMVADNPSDSDHDDSITLISAPSTTAMLGQDVANLQVENQGEHVLNSTTSLISSGFLVENTVSDHNGCSQTPEVMENKMLTENHDIAYRSTTNALVDLFSELEEVVSGPRLRELLSAAWKENSLVTLKIIFNARSIHLGKASRSVFYRCAGWLASEHPLTLLLNLEWLSRPVIRKKTEGKDVQDASDSQVNNSVAHGYYKDLLNILVLAAQDKLDGLANPRDVLNVESDKKKKDKRQKDKKIWDANLAKARRHETSEAQHATIIKKFTEDPFYRVLHITIARIFASQLGIDLALLRGTDTAARRNVSLCAKWAPSHKLFHDKHTFIVSSIAEILHPQAGFKDISDRETYLRHAREAYRKDVAGLRKALEVVERDVSAKKFSGIKYSHVPSLAMNRYSGLFAEKDFDRFNAYVEKVTEGKQKISGAVLLPSKMISTVRDDYLGSRRPVSTKAMFAQKMEDLNAKVIDGQWKTLVNRIRESGTLSGSIAVCDVSGSMFAPTFHDGTTPVDSSIGLSLLVAEVTAPPFGGRFITFASRPQFQEINLGDSLADKVRKMQRADWGASTDLVAVFERLLLPEALKHKVKPENMVKRIFVFSDMQFDAASHSYETDNVWSSSFERIQKHFEHYGYEMPQLIFWNLAGGRAGYTGSDGDPTAPKPVTSDEPGTALVSGYSQGLLKVFLDSGEFEDPGEAVEEEIVDLEGEDQDAEVIVEKRKKVKLDPWITVKKAISHEAYGMLTVFD